MPKTRKKTNKVKHKARVRAVSKKMAKEQKDAKKKAKREKKAEPPTPIRGVPVDSVYLDDAADFLLGPPSVGFDDIDGDI